MIKTRLIWIVLLVGFAISAINCGGDPLTTGDYIDENQLQPSRQPNLGELSPQPDPPNIALNSLSKCLAKYKTSLTKMTIDQFKMNVCKISPKPEPPQ